MQHLLTNYHPSIAPLTHAMRDALHASIPKGPLGQTIQTTPWRAVLARVSDESRPKFQQNLDKDLDWLLGEPEAAWVKAHVTDVEAFRNTPEGDLARRRIGMHALYAPGTKRLVGGWLARNGWLFLFLLSSAAKADLEQNRNAVTEAIIAALLAMAHDNPHDHAGRPLLHAHALDRIVRNEQFAWTIFDTLTRTYVRVDAAGSPFDALGPNAKDQWTLITFGASRGRDDTARRFLIARLNKARAGNWPMNAISLPRGYSPTAEPDSRGRFNLTADPKKLSVSRPVPDPRERWQVQTIAAVCLDPAITTWKAVAVECGAAGLTARGADEIGEPLDALRDPTMAGRGLITPEKIRAYLTGRLAHTEKGVTPGQFNPGDGHRLEPRYPGDDLGHVTYDINVGRPEDNGWDWGVPPEDWRDILLKFWLPDDFTPAGWAWADEPGDWGWDQIRSAAGSPRRQATGQRAARSALRPFSGLLRWSDTHHRHMLYCSGTTNTGHDRYTWRREPHAESRRNARGNIYSMDSTDGEGVCSWPVREFHQAWATLAESLLTGLIADHPDAAPLPTASPMHAAARNTAEADRLQTARDSTLSRLRDEVSSQLADSDALMLSAARKRAEGDETSAAGYERLAATAQKAATDATERLERELLQPVPAPDSAAQPAKADFGTAAAVLAALTGSYATGPAPKALQTALSALGADSTRLELLDATTVRLTLTVTIRRLDGTPVHATGHTVLRRSRPNTKQAKELRHDAKQELARKWFHEGIDLPTLSHLAAASADHALRMVREQARHRHRPNRRTGRHGHPRHPPHPQPRPTFRHHCAPPARCQGMPVGRPQPGRSPPSRTARRICPAHHHQLPPTGTRVGPAIHHARRQRRPPRRRHNDPPFHARPHRANAHRPPRSPDGRLRALPEPAQRPAVPPWRC
ncbi:hypothetical protein [Nostocoides sp. HKS02]|uniref:hypothetical protein n=1 Tax=Nostocoides sp. HKS02 TaxID=1813880 RepID=UPI0012B4E738|nr:hypothetical protein [Tetrasphaera sp. HKS02]QGN58081.1 hypothetical protein GKE56_09475 [Tetrasphaera sp. HKS02]